LSPPSFFSAIQYRPQYRSDKTGPEHVAKSCFSGSAAIQIDTAHPMLGALQKWPKMHVIRLIPASAGWPPAGSIMHRRKLLSNDSNAEFRKRNFLRRITYSKLAEKPGITTTTDTNVTKL
jgi:hypothetical protein